MFKSVVGVPLAFVLLVTLAASACQREKPNSNPQPADSVVLTSPTDDGILADYAVVETCWREGRATAPLF